ncbi:uncharacterized protein Z520_01825 [Fonsecaea multimorphosa CBS 102226]|uniref:BZIP domain-containing protein n=1 Tax=Fonsecaea multimorphosa CBS 102226 TaxID=1442371 RepID=A0A0D2K6Y5_9EURO|nr:uncharacterized protein Z520_01825 [Fonsecaea multimorphosa CBS 102226]KIY01688.1 hypothetical protein Z520_01825 [Fonsecaea multimorphosa CBS 102226]OAL29883.1 hypothetical protein AYO22_01789 [Fonsecaea multimorphosa]
MDNLNLVNESGLLGFDETCTPELPSWNEKTAIVLPLASETSSLVALTPPYFFPRSESLSISTAQEDRTLSDVHLVVVDQHGRECEVVQTRSERRRAQNRKAQRAYRARKEAQLKAASSTLAANNSQLRTLAHHNRELLDTIKRLKAIILQLETENQLLKEVQSPNVNEMDDQSGWMLDGPSFMSPTPSELYWRAEDTSDTS